MPPVEQIKLRLNPSEESSAAEAGRVTVAGLSNCWEKNEN